MGTRGFLGVAADGVTKVGYNHFDSYPSGLGCELLGELRQLRQQLGDSWLTDLLALVRQLQVVPEDSKPTPEQVETLRWAANTSVDDGQLDNWYVLLRETQGSLVRMLQAGYVVDASSFPADSLFAEWGYVVALDADAPALEVYRGFQHSPPTAGRFAQAELREYSHDQYYPVELIAMFALDDLPSDEEFVDRCETQVYASEEDDE